MSAGNDAANAIAEAAEPLGALAKSVSNLIEKLEFRNQSSITYESFQTLLTPGNVTILLGADPTRTRAIITLTTDVYIGKRSNLNSSPPNGFNYEFTTWVETETMDEICAVYAPSGAPAVTYIGIWVERTKTNA